jgi:SAM-dependent methyltransferase
VPDNARSAADRLRGCFAEPLVDLGATDPALRGIFAPAGEQHAPRRGVTSQFLEHAADYAERYGNVDHFRVMLDDALARLDPPLHPAIVLDIGSGAGNSVLPLLDRDADAFVVATDISPKLLAILRGHLEREPRYAGRYALVCVDACRARYRPQAFDLAVGAAILHHLIEPAAVVEACGRALTPAGAAVFFEPFELGHAVLNVAYADLLAEAARCGDDAPGFAMLRRLAGDYAARRIGADDPRLLELDDKWMFSRSFFEDCARRGRFAECIVYPTHAIDAPLSEMTRVNLRLGMQLDADALPGWAWARLREIEQGFSPQARRELMFEGAVVLRTSPAALPQSPGRSAWWYEAAAPGRGFFVERVDDEATIVCCHYDDIGAPIWHFAGPAPLRDGRVETTASPGDLPFSFQFIAKDRAAVEWAGARIDLTPQHPGSASSVGAGSGIGGFWIEEAREPQVYAAIEDLDDRLFVALLDDEGWLLCIATRRAADAYAGEWLRFAGGQHLGGPYRAPGAPTRTGDARIMRLPMDRIVLQKPGGAHCMLERARMTTPAR